MRTTNKFICYLDILGFQNRIENVDSSFSELYEKLIEDIKSGIAPYNKINLYTISDSVTIIAEDIEDVINASFDIYATAFDKGIFIRGALTKGPINDPIKVQIEGNRNIVVPYLGKGYKRAYELEKEINCSAIYVDNFVSQDERIKDYVFKYTEIFPKERNHFEKAFLISNMKNSSASKTRLAYIINEIPNLPEHDAAKFINTFCLYYKAMRDKYKENVEWYHQHWVRILEILCGIESS